MRPRRTTGAILAATLMLAAPSVADTDLGSWVGTWFKLRMRMRGLAIASTGFHPRGNASTGYLKLWDTDHTGGFSVDLYEEVSGTWMAQPTSMSYTATNPGDFVFLAELGNPEHVLFLVGRVQAKGPSGATLRSLGGLGFNRAPGGGPPTFAGGLVVSGRRIPETAVPVPVGSRLH